MSNALSPGADPSNKSPRSGKQAIAVFRIAGTGCPSFREPILANFALVIANFAKKATKSSQKPKEYVAIISHIAK